VFQSLVAAAAARGLPSGLDGSPFQAALMWLERQKPPQIIAPEGHQGQPYRLSVPNNAMDIVANAWCRDNYSNTGDANPATHRTMKTVCPTWVADNSAIYYLWPLEEPESAEARALAEAARSVVALGWGVDLVAGHCEILTEEMAAALPGERWLPGRGGTGFSLRAPVQGTLADLTRRHRDFLARLKDGVFNPPPPLSAYAVVPYRRAQDAPSWSGTAFSLLKTDTSGFRPFDTARQALSVVGMTRHAVQKAARADGWQESDINSIILGHGGEEPRHKNMPVGPRRFAYLPLPSLESRGAGMARVVGPVRRMLLFSFDESMEKEMAWARRVLPDQELISEDTKLPMATMALLPRSDPVVKSYTRESSSWATVTPVVLPGYDDPAHYRRRLAQDISADEQQHLLGLLERRIDKLLRKALINSGFSSELAFNADLDWRKVGFQRGCELADRYGVPDHLRCYPRYHVRLVWRNTQGKALPLPGPVCIGAGRFYGLGLFSAVEP
jgi:CRISPR-associated protein Csb2